MVGKEDGLCSSRSYLFSVGVTTKKTEKGERYSKKGSLGITSFELSSFVLFTFFLQRKANENH